MTDLSKRYDFQIPEALSTWDRQVTVREDGTYSIVFVSDHLPTLKEMTYVQKRVWLSEHSPNEMGIVIKYDGPKAIFFGTYQKSFRAVGRRIFTKRQWVDVIRYDGTRIIWNKSLSFRHTPYPLFETMIHFFGLEGIFLHDSYTMCSMVFRNKQVLKGVFAQRITNLRDAVKTWLASSCKVRLSDLDYSIVKDYLNSTDEGPADIINYAEFTTSLEKTMRKVAEWNRTIKTPIPCGPQAESDGTHEEAVAKADKAKTMLRLFLDIMGDAKTLGVKVNPEWSQRRMNEEHLKYTHLIMALREGELSDKPIYEMTDSENAICETVNGLELKGTVLNDERSIFREGTLMHHCIFTGYGKRIQQKIYIALSFYAPERVTVGIGRHFDWKTNTFTNKAEIEQMHTVGNGNPSTAFHEAVNKWFKTKQTFFDGLLKQAETQPDEQPAMNVDLPFQQIQDYDEDIPF